MITVRTTKTITTMAQGWRDLFTIARGDSGETEWAFACGCESETACVGECASFGKVAPNPIAARRKRDIRILSYMVILGLLPSCEKCPRVIVCVY